MLLALIILLGIVCIYTKGNWFFVSTISIILGVSVIFTPIYISKYKFFSKIKKYNEFVSIFIDFVILNILLIVVNYFTIWTETTIDANVHCIVFLTTVILVISFFIMGILRK